MDRLKGIKSIINWGLKRLRYRDKLIICFIIVTLIPFLFLDYWSYTIATGLLEDQAKYSYSQTLQQVQINIQKRLKQMDEVSDLIVSDPGIQDMLASAADKTDYEQLLVYQRMDKYIETLEKNFKFFRIRLYLARNTFFSSENTRFFDLNDLKDMKGIPDVLSGVIKEIVWKTTYQNNYLSNKKTWVISIYRTLNDISKDEAYGVFFIDITEDELFSNISGDMQKDGTKTYIIDKEGYIVSSSNRSDLGKLLDTPVTRSIRNNEDSGFVLNNHLIIYKTITPSEFILVSDIPLSVIKNEAGKLNQIILLITVVTIFLAIVISLLLSKTLLRKLNYLFAAMKKNKQDGNEIILEEISLPASFKSEDEIDQLFVTYNNMVSRIRKLIDEVLLARVDESEAKFKLLQAQINPHFLYNVLESINSCVVGNRNEEASKMIHYLSSFYRIVLSKGREKITIKEELESVKLYLNMLSMSYKGKFDFKIDIDEGILPFIIVKLSLQPIVENAIMHGFMNKEELGLIQIEGYFRLDDIVIRISDNGVGISDDNLISIQQALIEGSVNEGKGYGLMNVNARLMFYHSDKYGLRLFSKIGEGTTVEITVPQEI